MEPYRNPALGLVCRFAGVLLIGLALAGFLLRGSLLSGSFLLTALIPIVGGAGGYLFILGRRLSAVTAAEAMAKDSRPPVVYLRSFREDGELAASHGELVGFPSSNTEQIVARIMNRIGPFVAIGKPGEPLPELGAARMYVADDAWQDEINALLEKSSLVLLRRGNTEGFWWEVKRVVERVPPEKVLFLLNWSHGAGGVLDDAGYEAFRRRADEHLPHPLPEEIGEACFLAFDAEWRPLLLGSFKKLWQAGYYNKPDFIAAELTPFLDRYGVKVDKPRVVSKGIWIAGAILIALALLFTILARR